MVVDKLGMHGCARWSIVWLCLMSFTNWNSKALFMGMSWVPIGVRKCLLIIFANYIPQSLFTSGMVVWTPLVCYVLYYNVESLDQAFNTCYEIVSVVLIGIVHFWEEENATMRELLRITTIYKNAIILIFSSSKGPHQLKQCIIFGWTLFIL